MALLEFNTIASGVLASDLMLKRSPIALLRCGTIHPGRFLILIGGSVASTQEAFESGKELGEAEGSLSGSVFLGDVHPNLHDAVLGMRRDLTGDSLAVVETRSSPRYWPRLMRLSRALPLCFLRFAWVMTLADMHWR